MHAAERARVCVKVVTAILKEKSKRRTVWLEVTLPGVEQEAAVKGPAVDPQHIPLLENFKLSDAVVLGYIPAILYQ